MIRKIFIGLITFLYLTGTALASPPQKVVFFGDSLSDDGNLYSLSLHFVPKTPPYYKGRFSNGSVWSDTVAQAYLDHYQVPSTNYAYGGATSAGHNPFSDPTVPITLTTELNDYLFRTMFQDKSTTLFVIWIGANDYLFDKSIDPNTLTNSVVDEISKTVDTLVKDKAQSFLIVNLPDISKTPLAKEQSQLSERFHTLAVLHNQKLASLITKAKEKYPEVKFITVDISTIFDKLIDNPEIFNETYHVNIHDVTHPCWPGGYTFKRTDKAFNGMPAKVVSEILNSPDLSEAMSVAQQSENGVTACSDPETHLFWDKIHPTAAGHQVIAGLIWDQLMLSGLG